MSETGLHESKDWKIGEGDVHQLKSIELAADFITQGLPLDCFMMNEFRMILACGDAATCKINTVRQ